MASCICIRQGEQSGNLPNPWLWPRCLQQAVFLSISMLPQKKFIIFSYKTCLYPGKLSAQFPCYAASLRPACVLPERLHNSENTYPQSSPLPSLWQQGTGAWLSCSRGCSFHSPSQEGTLVSLLLIHSPGGRHGRGQTRSVDRRGLPLSSTLLTGRSF